MKLPANSLYQQLQLKKQTRQKAFAVLIDPDNIDEAGCRHLLTLSQTCPVDYFFIGGSLITQSNQSALIQLIKSQSEVPVILFPSSGMHIDSDADAILLLSLISGRNPDLLIGQHVISAPLLKSSGLEILPTGYMLIDTGRQTTASYMSGTTPIPFDKPAIAACTAMAGEQLGLKLIYMDGGSGAMHAISPAMIKAVQRSIEIPLVVGGGVNTVEKAQSALDAGADVLVVGNEIERNPEFLTEVSKLVQSYNLTADIRA